MLLWLKNLHEEFLVLVPPSTYLLGCLLWKKNLKKNIISCLEKREGHRERGDSHPVHQLARPWRAWGSSPASQAAKESERFQQLLQRPHCGALQVNDVPPRAPGLLQSLPWGLLETSFPLAIAVLGNSLWGETYSFLCFIPSAFPFISPPQSCLCLLVLSVLVLDAQALISELMPC